MLYFLMNFLSDTDTYSGDVKEMFVVDGVVLDEDSMRMAEGHGLKELESLPDISLAE